jgi:hypothetical protein
MEICRIVCQHPRRHCAPEEVEVAVFELHATSVEQSIEDIEGLPISTLLCGGIVNPFGPTLNVLAALGEFERDRTLPLVYLMLNPFVSWAQEIGRCIIGKTWTPVRDWEPLLSLDLGSCPSFVLPSVLLQEAEAIAIHAIWLQRARDARAVWNSIKAHAGNPWTRVNADVANAAEKYVEPMLRGDSLPEAPPDVPIEYEEALKFSEYVLSPGHMETELQALSGAWKHAIDLQRNAGNRLPVIMDVEAFTTWLGAIARTCRFPSAPTH